MNQSQPSEESRSCPGFEEWLRNSLSDALVGNTPRPLVAFSFACREGSKQIWLKAHFEHGYTPDDYDLVMAVEAEMWAQFPDDFGYKISVEFETVGDGCPIHPLAGGILHLRSALGFQS